MCKALQNLLDEGIQIGEERGEVRGISIGEARGNLIRLLSQIRTKILKNKPIDRRSANENLKKRNYRVGIGR